MLKIIIDFKPLLTVIRTFGNKNLSSEHKKRILKLLENGYNAAQNDGKAFPFKDAELGDLTLSKINDSKIDLKFDRFEIVSREATSEAECRTHLERIKSEQKDLKFTCF